jgi:hypothetical protein
MVLSGMAIFGGVFPFPRHILLQLSAQDPANRDATAWDARSMAIVLLSNYPEAIEENRFDRSGALKLYTLGSSWFSSEDGKKGALVPGQLADLAVVSGDYLSIPEEEIKGLESVLKIMGGRVVYTTEEHSSLAPPQLPVSPDWSPVAHYGGYAQASQSPAETPVSTRWWVTQRLPQGTFVLPPSSGFGAWVVIVSRFNVQPLLVIYKKLQGSATHEGTTHLICSRFVCWRLVWRDPGKESGSPDCRSTRPVGHGARRTTRRLDPYAKGQRRACGVSVSRG